MRTPDPTGTPAADTTSARPAAATTNPFADRFTGPLSTAWAAATTAGIGPLLLPVGHALPVPPATERHTWDPARGRLDSATLEDLRARAEADLGTPWPQTLSQAYSRYFRDGDRDGYEQAVFARQRRLSRAVVLAALTLEPGWLDEVADGITVLCEQSSWCWPAHDDTFRVHGAVVPTVDDPFVDLGAGEVVGQLAWLDHLLGEPLDAHVPGLRTRVRYEADRRVLEPFERRRNWHWLGLDGDVHNWNPWIHGNVLVAALQLVDDPERRARLVDLVVEGLDRYVAALPADGAIDEGYAYWWNGACRTLEALDVLHHATGGVLDGTAVPALRATVAFPHRMHLGDGWYLNLADGPARPPAEQPWHALHRAARRVGDLQAQAHAAAQRRTGEPVAREDDGLGRLLRALTDDEWRTVGAGRSPLPRDVWLPSIQVLLARPHAGAARGLTLAVKGGHNGEHHNHNDVGSVVVALGGVPVLVDAGRPTYTAQTFGPDRYGIWTMQSTWHSVPEIRGTAQGMGRQFHATAVSPTVDEAHAQLTMQLHHAYPRTDIVRWQRTARLDREAGRVTLTDEWELDDDPSALPTVAHLLLAGDVDLADGRAVVHALEGAGTVVVAWTPSTAGAAIDVRRLDDPWLTRVWGDRLTRVTIDTGGTPAGRFEVSVEEDR